MSSIPPEDDLDATRVAHYGELQSDLQLRTAKRDRPCLIVLAGHNVGEMYRIEGAETVVGRASNAQVRLSDDGISRRHARVVQLGSDIVIEDLQSANGTYVNGVNVNNATLNDGDKIRLGSTTVLKFTFQDQLDESFQQQMYDAALRDGLTKAYNKTYFLDRLETEFAYAKRHRADLSLLMFDVDHFKKVNDTYGHLAGDYVLAKIARLAAGTLRSEDLFARYGGEEFAIVCRAVPLDQAGILAERIRSVVESTVFDFEGRRMAITISVGVAAHPNTPLETSLELIAAADEALYEAKRCGRNRVLLKKSA
jgi:two-component system, cell cycle response regulator